MILSVLTDILVLLICMYMHIYVAKEGNRKEKKYLGIIS